MKTQLVICTIFLLGLVGMESLKKEQFQHLWSILTGYSLPAAVPVKQNDLECPSKKQDTPMASKSSSDKIENNSMTCFLLYNPSKTKFLSCESLRLNATNNSIVL